MASQVEPWIVNKLLSLNRVHDAQHDGEYCQILKWCQRRDPLDVDAVITAEISDRDVHILLNIPHTVACEVEDDSGHERISEIKLPCIAMLQRFSVESDAANPHWVLVARKLAIQGGYGEPPFGKPSWYLNYPKLRDWRPAIGELSIPMRQRDPSALPSLGLTKSRSPLKLIPQDGHQGDRAMSRNSPPRSRLFSRDDNKRSDAGFVTCVDHLKWVRLYDAVNLLTLPTNTTSASNFAPSTPLARSHAVHYQCSSPPDPSSVERVQDIIRSLPADAEIDADPPLLSPGPIAVDAVDDGFDTDPGEGTDSNVEDGISALSPTTRNSDTMKGEDPSSTVLSHLNPPRTPIPAVSTMSLSPTSWSSGTSTDDEHPETDWDPTPPRPIKISSEIPIESRPNETASQGDVDERCVVAILEPPPRDSPERVPSDAQLLNLPKILVPSSDPSSLPSSLVGAAPELQSQTLSTPAARPSVTEFNVQQVTRIPPEQALSPPGRSVKRRRLNHDVAPQEEAKYTPPRQNVNGHKRRCSPNITPLSHTFEPQSSPSSQRSGGYAHSGSGRPERFVITNRISTFEAGKARRPGSNRRSWVTNSSSDEGLPGDTANGSDSSDAHRRPVRANAKSKVCSLAATNRVPVGGSIGAGRRERKMDDVFLQTPRSPVPILSIPASRFSLQNLRRSPSSRHATTDSSKTCDMLPTPVGSPRTNAGFRNSPTKGLGGVLDGGAYDTGNGRRRSTISASSSNSGNVRLRPRAGLNEAGTNSRGSVVQCSPQNDLFGEVIKPGRPVSDEHHPKHVRRIPSLLVPSKRSLSVQSISDHHHLSESFEDVPVINLKLNRMRSRGSLGSSRRTSSDFGNPENYHPPTAGSSSRTGLIESPLIRSQSRNTLETPLPQYSNRNNGVSSSPMFSSALTNNPFPVPTVAQRASVAYIPKSHISRSGSVARSAAQNSVVVGPSSVATSRGVPVENYEQPVPLARPASPVHFTPTFTRGYFTTAECVDIIRRAKELRRNQGAP